MYDAVVYHNRTADLPDWFSTCVRYRPGALDISYLCDHFTASSVMTLGAVHNCQHLCIRTERTEGGGGLEASVLIFKC